jgi:CheY-like chemotaxis protein
MTDRPSLPTSPAGHSRSDADKARLTIPGTLLAFLVLGILALICLSVTFHIVLWAAVIWGLAMYASGVLGGFVFGIPRVLDREPESGTPAAPTPDPKNPDAATERLRAAATNGAARLRRRTSTNSNLVEVSDWLTKIIVGVGLVELKRLPEHGESLAGFIGHSIIPVMRTSQPTLSDASVSLSGAIALYFGVLGFITGYLLTRIFLAVVMSLADRDIDAVESPMEMPGGQRLPLQDLLEGFRASIADVQSKVAQLFAPAGTPAPAMANAAAESAPRAAGAAAPRRPRRILWVDDTPNRNALLAARLRQAAIVVDQVTTTSEALLALSKQEYAAVITDVVRRTEDDPEQAGLRLIRELRLRFPSSEDTAPDHLPVLVFCGRSSETKARREALADGADLVTSSHVELLARLTKELGPL